MLDIRSLAAGCVWLPLVSIGSSLAAQPPDRPQVPSDTALPGAAPPGTAAPAPDEFDLQQALEAGDVPLSASRAAALAVDTAPTIEAAEAVRLRAREAAGEALVAAYPRLDLEASYTRVSPIDSPFSEISAEPAMTGIADLNDFIDGLSSSFRNLGQPPLDQFTLQATLRYPLSDLFFKILPAYRASSRAAEAEGLNVKVEQLNVALSAREAFYEYARAKAALAVAQAAVVQAQAQRRDVASLVAAGTLARVELMRADAVVASTRVAASRAEGALAVGRTALGTLMHADAGGEFAIAEELAVAPPLLAEGRQALVDLAFRNRSEIKALRILAEVHETTADVHAADRYPKLAIGGAAEYSKPNPRVIGQTDWAESWAAFASLSWSPSDLAAGSSRAAQARAELMRTQADLRALEDALRLEVTRAYEDYQAARAAMEAAEAGIAAAEESYRVRREQFRAGSAVATEVVDSEAELRRARLELVNAAIDVRIALARLERAVER